MPSASPTGWSGEDDLPTHNDIVIALMGMTGAGKSSFIDLFRPLKRPHIEHSLSPGTSKVEMYACRHKTLGRFWLIDTIGFDDIDMTDAQVLREIARWMQSAYLRNVQLTGILYLHSIEQMEFPNSAIRNVDLFERLVGEDALRKVLLVSTHWDRTPEFLSRRRASSNQRELEERRNFWGGLIEGGAQVDRHENTLTSAANIVERVISLRTDSDRGTFTRLQRELGSNGRLANTYAGQEVGRLLDEKERAFEEEKRKIQRVRETTLGNMDERHLRKIDEMNEKHKRECKQLKDDREILQNKLRQDKEVCETLQTQVAGLDPDSLRRRDELLLELKREQDREKALDERMERMRNRPKPRPARR